LLFFKFFEIFTQAHMANLLDEMLAEVEGTLSSPDRRELMTHASSLLRADVLLRTAGSVEHAFKLPAMASAPAVDSPMMPPVSQPAVPEDSPLPPPPSLFAAQHSGPGEDRFAEDVDLDAKLAARRKLEECQTAHSRGDGAGDGANFRGEYLAAKLAACRTWEEGTSPRNAKQDGAMEEGSNEQWEGGLFPHATKQKGTKEVSNIIPMGDSEDGIVNTLAVCQEDAPLFAKTDLFSALAPEPDAGASRSPDCGSSSAPAVAGSDLAKTLTQPAGDTQASGAASEWTISTCPPASKDDKVHEEEKHASVQDTSTVPSTHILLNSVDAEASIELSPEEFKEKVDRKIAYFETLARESRVKALEDAAAEQSMQEARSRIEASVTKRRESHCKSFSAAPVLKEDLKEAQRCLAFGPGSLSLNDLSDDSCRCGNKTENFKQNLAASVKKSSKELSASIAFSPVVDSAAETGTGRKNLAGNCPKSIFGISPVVEATTPDLFEDVSPCIDEATEGCEEHKQQQLFWNTKMPLDEAASDTDIQGNPVVEQSAVESAFDSPAASSTVQEERTKTWAGVLACATPTHVSSHSVSTCLSSRKDAHGGTQESSQRKVREKRNTALILGKLDTFLGSLRSPYGSAPEIEPDSNGSAAGASDEISAVQCDPSCNAGCSSGESAELLSQFANIAAPKMEVNRPDVIKDAEQCVKSTKVSEEERRRRAAAKRAAFLTNMDRLMQNQPASVPDDGHNDGGADSPAAGDNQILQSLETRAQRLSDIVSCDVSLSNFVKASFGSGPQDSDLQCHSNNSILTASQVSPNSSIDLREVQKSTISATSVVVVSRDICGANIISGPSQHDFLSGSCQEEGKYKEADSHKQTHQSAPASLFTRVNTRSSDLVHLAQNVSQFQTAYTANASAVTEAVSKPMEEAGAGPAQPDKEKFAGIGVQVKRVRGLITIVDLLPDGPAAQFLKKGQVVLQIDGSGDDVFYS